MSKSAKEQTIKYLLSLDRNYSNNNLTVYVNRKHFSETQTFPESEFINQLTMLSAERYISFSFPTKYRDLSYGITITLYESVLNYFNNKRTRKIKNIKRLLWEFIKFAIPTTISLIALLKSFDVF